MILGHPPNRGLWSVALALALTGCAVLQSDGTQVQEAAEQKSEDNAWFKAKSGQDLINTYYWADYYWARQHRSEGLDSLPPELQACLSKKGQPSNDRLLPLWGYANCWMAAAKYDLCRFATIQGHREEMISECRDLPLEIYLYDPKVLRTFAGLGDKTSIELQDTIQNEIKKFSRESAP